MGGPNHIAQKVATPSGQVQARIPMMFIFCFRVVAVIFNVLIGLASLYPRGSSTFSRYVPSPMLVNRNAPLPLILIRGSLLSSTPSLSKSKKIVQGRYFSSRYRSEEHTSE